MNISSSRNQWMAAVIIAALALAAATGWLATPASAQTLTDVLTAKRFAFGPVTLPASPNQNPTQFVRITYTNLAKSARGVSIEFRHALDGTVLKVEKGNVEPGKGLVSVWGGMIDTLPAYGVLTIKAVSPTEVVDPREAAASSMELFTASGTVLLADPRPTP
jgi:hypothetical protein